LALLCCQQVLRTSVRKRYKKNVGYEKNSTSYKTEEEQGIPEEWLRQVALELQRVNETLKTLLVQIDNKLDDLFDLLELPNSMKEEKLRRERAQVTR